MGEIGPLWRRDGREEGVREGVSFHAPSGIKTLTSLVKGEENATKLSV